MDEEMTNGADDASDVPLLPTWAIGRLLFPVAMQFILANPPANDTDPHQRRV